MVWVDWGRQVLQCHLCSILKPAARCGAGFQVVLGHMCVQKISAAPVAAVPVTVLNTFRVTISILMLSRVLLV
jgi:hypothetical protein